MEENKTLVKREISTIDEMTSFIDELKLDAPRPIEAALKAQLQIIRFVQSPTLSDTILTTLVDNLDESLHSCTNVTQRSKIRKQFSSMIQNFIFFLDARVQYCCHENKERSKQLFVMAGEMFSDNMRDLMLLTIQNFGMVVKVGADVIDVGGIIMAEVGTTMGTEAINSAKTGKTITTDADGNITTEEKGLDPEIAGQNAKLAEHTVDTINGNLGELSDRVSTHINQWQEKVENTIINNIFSPEQIEKKNTFNSKMYDWWYQYEIIATERADFYETVNNTIEKLGHYYKIIGKSIVIHDMIKRYLPELEKYLYDKFDGDNNSGGLLGKPLIKKLPPVKVIKWAESKIETAVDTITGRDKKREKEVQSIIQKYREIAEHYDRMVQLLDPSMLGLNEKEQEYYDSYKIADSKGRISESERQMLEELRKRLGISITRAKEIEDFV